MRHPIEDVEAVLVALLDLAATGYPFASAKRKLELAIKDREYPAIYVYSDGEDIPRPIRGIPPLVTIDASIWIYADSGRDNDEAPEIQMNACILGVKKALEPQHAMQECQTLGLPWVSHCWIEGHIEKFPGVIDGIAKAIIPVKILCIGGPT